MLTFKINTDIGKVIFCCGQHFIGSISFLTYEKVGRSRLISAAMKFRDFGSLKAREDLVAVSRDAMMDAGFKVAGN